MRNTNWHLHRIPHDTVFHKLRNLFKNFSPLWVSLKGNWKTARICFAVCCIWKSDAHHTEPGAKVGVGEGFLCEILRSSSKWMWMGVTGAGLWGIAKTKQRHSCAWRHSLPTEEKETRLNCCLQTVLDSLDIYTWEYKKLCRKMLLSKL